MHSFNSNTNVAPVFSQFFAEHDNLDNQYENIKLKAGDSVTFQRFQNEGFYFVNTGLLKLQSNLSKPRLLRLCASGDLVGFEPRDLNTQLIALKDSTLQFWTKKAFFELRDKNIHINDLIIQHLVETIFHKEERIALLETISAETRLTNLFNWLARKFGVQCSDGVLLDIDLDRESIAQMAGTTTVTVARMITHFEKKNILKRFKRKIILLNSVQT